MPSKTLLLIQAKGTRFTLHLAITPTESGPSRPPSEAGRAKEKEKFSFGQACLILRLLMTNLDTHYDEAHVGAFSAHSEKVDFEAS